MTRILFLLCALSITAMACDPARKEEKACSADLMLCSDRCTAVATDPTNCGECGARCGPYQICSAGQCQCGPGATACGSVCADLSSDPDHCGACNASCTDPMLCSTSGSSTSCKDACASGQTACGRACVDLEADRYDCGACGRACGTREDCRSGRCVADLYLACFNTNEVREASSTLEAAGLPLSTDDGPIGMAWLGSALFVANSLANTVSHVSFDPPAVRSTYGESSIKILANGGWMDLEFIEAHGRLLYVSNASVSTITVLSSEDGLVDEIPLAEQAADVPSPQGITFVDEKGYVALNKTDQIAVLNVSTRKVSSWIDVSHLVSSGGDARPARFAQYGDRLFVTLWNIDASFNPAGSGRLAVIDTVNDTLDSSVTDGGMAGEIDLGEGCVNPGDLALLGDVLYVTCGVYGGTGAIVRIDLSSLPLFQKQTIAVPSGVSPGKLAFCKGVGYFGDINSGRVFRFEPGTEQMTGSALCPAGTTGDTYVPDIVCGP